MSRRTFTVSEVNKYVKGIFDNDVLLNNILIVGEISNYKKHYSNHGYFSLKDEESTINVVMFKSYFNKIPFEIENGQKVILLGEVTLYEQTGSYQIIAEQIEPVGKGAFQFAYEQLKEQLSEKGYFDSVHKKNIPLYPKTIGIVTSNTGAVVHDFINIVKRRNKTIKIILAPSKVQGLGASRTIKEAIENLNEYNVDLIIVARGGGSIEDLWCYNEEITVDAIFNSKIPIISAVGHETDFTLSDFTADLRASTPSEAAEISAPNLHEMKIFLENKLNILTNCFDNGILSKQNIVRISYNNLYNFKINETTKIKNIYDSLNIIMENKLDLEENKTSNYIEKLNLNNPINILNKGFSIVEHKNKRLLTVNSVNNEDEVKIILKDGVIDTKVLKVRNTYG